MASTQQSILGIMPPEMTPVRHQARHLGGVDHVDQGVLVLGVPQQAPHVGEQDQLLRAQASASLAAAVSALML